MPICQLLSAQGEVEGPPHMPTRVRPYAGQEHGEGRGRGRVGPGHCCHQKPQSVGQCYGFGKQEGVPLPPSLDTPQLAPKCPYSLWVVGAGVIWADTPRASWGTGQATARATPPAWGGQGTDHSLGLHGLAPSKDPVGVLPQSRPSPLRREPPYQGSEQEGTNPGLDPDRGVAVSLHKE